MILFIWKTEFLLSWASLNAAVRLTRYSLRKVISIFHSSDDSDTLMPDGLSYKDPTSFLGSTTFSIPSLSKLWVRIGLIELSTLWVREVLSY